MKSTVFQIFLQDLVLDSSSTFSVGLLNAVYNFNRKKISKENLYKKAIYLERDILNENVGSQDQIAAAVGGFKFD